MGLRSLHITLPWSMDLQQVALGARGHVEGARASFIAQMIVHNFKQQVCPKFLHLGLVRGPHERSGNLYAGRLNP
ncbi:hypothetical protein HanRHA438_Chr03g0100551 [Helianthus annuus]|nr:hypothetical protein HanRHA438_Chr03g0100551 [Helianthus annuus]